MSSHNEVIRALRAMSEIYGRTLNQDAAEILLDDLKGYPVPAILNALRSCRKELPRFPTTSDIISRLQASDGRPGPEEAWSMIPKNDEGSVVWTEEMSRAYGAAHKLLRENDTVAARMAFKETYEREVREARNSGISVKWTPCLGFEKSGRAAAVEEARSKGRITLEDARKILPELEYRSNGSALIEDKSIPPSGFTNVSQLVANIMKQIQAPKEDA